MLGALLALAVSQASVPEAAPPGTAVEPGAATVAPAAAPAAGCERCELLPRDDRAWHLTRRIADLDVRIASVSDAWPQSAVVLVFAGVSFGPVLTVVGGLMVGLGAGTIPALLVPGVVVLVVGLVGVALMVWGTLKAARASDEARRERAVLMEERTRLEQELQAMPRSERAAPALPLLSLEF